MKKRKNNPPYEVRKAAHPSAATSVFGIESLREAKRIRRTREKADPVEWVILDKYGVRF